LIDDINENKDENEAEVAAPTVHRHQIKTWKLCLFLLIIIMWLDLSVAAAFILNIHFDAKYDHYNKYESLDDYNMMSIHKISTVPAAHGINKYFVHTLKYDRTILKVWSDFSGILKRDIKEQSIRHIRDEWQDFEMISIGAKCNIYIDKQFTKSWINFVRPRFNDEAAIQMIQKYAKQYKFIVAVINYQQIHDKYGINKYDLPNSEFINKLLLKIRIVRDDPNKINWSNLKLFKSQSLNNDPINKSVTIAQKVMKEYCFIALERLNHSNNKNANNNNMFIPIVAIDKHHNYYDIEWVLIVHIIHRNCAVGIAFQFNDKMNTFIATAIYLKFDCCKHLRPFSLRKFKSDRNSIIDDDDADINNIPFRNNNDHYQQMPHEMVEYKKMYETEQLKNHHLEQQIQNTNQMYLSQINALQHEQQHIMNQQHLMKQQQQMQQHQMHQQQEQPQNYEQGYDGYTG